MENTTGTTPYEQEPKKSTPAGMIAISIILAIALVSLVFIYFNQKNKMVEMETALTQEKDSLANELRLMVVRYDTLKTNNDSLNAGLEREKTRIVQLLSLNASNTQLIKKYKSEITTMREIMKSYIIQIDSLNTRNKVLVAENTEIHQKITQVTNTNTELSKVKEELSSKVEIASAIQASDIKAVTINKKLKPVTRLNSLEKLRVGFTLRENPLAESGSKQIFMRVMRPDSLVITSTPDNLFEFKGNKIIYSATRTIEYNNKQDIGIEIYLNKTGDFVIGNYSVDLYLDNNIIGRTSFIITKK